MTIFPNFFVLLFFISLTLLAEEKQGTDKDAFHWHSIMGRGVNLGNALEAPTEGSWGITLQAGYFDLIAKAGFKTVRIPIRWSAHAGMSAPYTIEPSFLERVDWAIEQALKNKLVIVINMHHYKELTENPKGNRARFLAMWKQLAEHYKDQPETVCFELYNEPHGKLTADLWNDLLVDCLKIVRSSNPKRAVIIGGVQWNSIVALEKLKLPKEDRNIIVTTHYYLPFKFTHQGARWVGEQSQKWLGTKWEGTAVEKAKIRADFDIVKAWSKKHNRPVYMGEFGVYSKADLASRELWTSFVREELESRSIAWSYWEFAAGFGIYNPKEKVWRRSLLEALIPKGE